MFLTFFESIHLCPLIVGFIEKKITYSLVCKEFRKGDFYNFLTWHLLVIQYLYVK